MSTTPKKPPGSGSAAASTPNTARKALVSSNSYSAASNGPPNRSPSRMAAQATNGTTTTRPVRNGAPVSARAAVKKPTAGDGAEDDDAKAELQAKLDELQERLSQTEHSLSSSQRQAEVLQVKLDEALKDQTMLEDNVNEHNERIEELEHERKERERARREMEQIYEAERAATMREKEEAMAREEEMQTSLIRLKEALQQREIRASIGGGGEESERSARMSLSRTSSHRRSNNASPNPEAAFAPSSLQRSDSRSSSRLVHQKDKIIEGLRLELAEAQIKLVELENKGGGHVQLLEKDMYELKMQNARLMEENESFQLLLSEKTLNGDFTAISPADTLRAPSNQDSRPPSRIPESRKRMSLADELDAQDDSTEPDSAATESVIDTKERRLQSEVNSLKDQNKALTLYINNIISRLLQHEQFEQILEQTPDLMAGPGAASKKYAATNVDTDKELPPPPPPKDERSTSIPAQEDGQPQSLLQRAGSVLRGRPTRPTRPGSQLAQQAREQSQPRLEEPTVHEHPDTAPQIPFSRSRSTRAAPGHKRANSDWPAASVVTNMYKGPPPASSQGPLSPGLGSPSGRNSPFFPLGAGHRAASGGSVPTISETEAGKENQAPGQELDPKVRSESRGNRDSVTSNPGDRPVDLDPGMLAAGEVSSNPSSPPRSTTSSGERDSRAGSGGAIMMGSKPRPLRLVQEAQDDDKARKAANRGSWFGWMNKGGAGAGNAGGMPAFMYGRSGSDAGRSGSDAGQ